MFDNDLFVDDDNVDNQLDFLKQARNQRGTQPYQQNKIEQDLRVENEDDDDFNHHFSNNKNKQDDEPQKLDDLLNQNENSQQDFLSNNVTRLTKGRGAPSRITQSRAGAGQNVNNILYDNTSNASNNNNQNDDIFTNFGDTQKSLQFGNSELSDLSNSISRPVTGSRPGTSTTMNARVKLAAQQCKTSSSKCCCFSRNPCRQ